MEEVVETRFIMQVIFRFTWHGRNSFLLFLMSLKRYLGKRCVLVKFLSPYHSQIPKLNTAYVTLSCQFIIVNVYFLDE
jgi:hypothetical protein